MSPARERSEIERFNTVVFGAVFLAFALSFVEGGALLRTGEAVLRAAVLALLGYGLAQWRREYLGHWTSWLALVVGLASAVRLAQLLSG